MYARNFVALRLKREVSYPDPLLSFVAREQFLVRRGVVVKLVIGVREPTSAKPLALSSLCMCVQVNVTPARTYSDQTLGNCHRPHRVIWLPPRQRSLITTITNHPASGAVGPHHAAAPIGSTIPLISPFKSAPFDPSTPSSKLSTLRISNALLLHCTKTRKTYHNSPRHHGLVVLSGQHEQLGLGTSRRRNGQYQQAESYLGLSIEA